MAENRKHNTVARRLKKAAILAVSVLFSAVAVAQNEGQYTHFMFNRLSYNPAFAGSQGNLSATLFYNNQWMGLNLQGATVDGKAGVTPTNYLFSFDMPVGFLHGGLGLTLNMEQVGYHNNLTIAPAYAFRIFWGPGSLSAAVEADLYNYQFNTKDLYGVSDLTGSFTNPTTASGDPLVSHEEVSQFLFDLSTGLYYQVPSLYYVGLSVKNLLASKSS